MKKEIFCKMNYLKLIILLISLSMLPTKSWGNHHNPSIPPAGIPQVPSMMQQSEFWEYLELVGVIIEVPEGKNLALINDKKNDYQDFYSIGANVPGGAKVVNIFKNGVLLEKDNISYMLELRQSIDESDSDESESGYKKLSSNEWNLNVEKMFPDLWDVVETFKDVRVAEFRCPDGTSALRIDDLSEDHLLKHIGLEKGDIVEEINGQLIDNTSDLLDHLLGLDNQSDIIVSVDRQGKKTELKYHITSNEPSYSHRQVRQAAKKTGLLGVMAKVSW